MHIIQYIPIIISVASLFFLMVYWLIHHNQVKKKRKTDSFANGKELNNTDYWYGIWIMILITSFLVVFPTMRYDIMKNFISVIASSFFSIFNIVLSLYVFMNGREHSQIGVVDFKTAVIKNYKKDSSTNETSFSIVLNDDEHKTNQKHYISPEKLSVSFYHNKAIFNDEKCFEKLNEKTSWPYYVKFDVETDSIGKNNTSVCGKNLAFSFDITDKGNKIGDSLNREYFYDDAKMMVVEISYKVAGSSKTDFIQNINRDLFTYKLFFYLNNYDSQNGIHNYVRIENN